MTALAQLNNVSQRFGKIQALDNVSLSIVSNSVVGMLGPNGGGKSAIISLLEGSRPPTSGTVELFGGSPRDYRNRRLVGCTPQETALPETLRVARRLAVIWAAQGGTLDWWVVVGALIWTAVTLALALLLFRSDQGLRFR